MKKHLLAGLTLAALAAGTTFVYAQDDTAAAAETTEAATQTTEATEEAASEFQTLEQKVSYGIGYQLASEFKSAGFELEPDLFLAAMKDALSGAEPKVDRATFDAAMQELQQKMMEKMQSEMAEQEAANAAGMAAEVEANKAAAAEFLAENAEREGVKTLESGMQYEVLAEGAADGESPTLTDMVKVHYTGTLLNGTQFDSSVGGEPATFRPSGVIAGWTEALQMMKPGDKWKLYIPSDLAYGDSGRPPVIPPASLLIFEVELIEVVK